MSNFEMAMKNHVRGLWTSDMLKTLVKKGKITSLEYEEIVGEPYPEDGEISDTEALNEIKGVL